MTQTDLSADLRPFGSPDRSALRRLLEVRGVVGGHRMPHEVVHLLADDGTRLVASHLPGPAGAPAIVHLHGFGAHRRKPAYAGFADALAGELTVLSVDLRGHGRSRGQSSLGDREALDVRAAVTWLREAGHDWVGVVGVSMGATSAVHALDFEDRPDAVVAISAPPRLHEQPRTEPMARLHTLWTSRPHRLGFRMLTGVRVVPVSRWQSPPHPEEVIARRGSPVLLVHGVDDHFFPIDEWRVVADREGVPLWEEPVGFGHAEDGLSAEFARRIARAVRTVHRDGRFPTRDEVST